MKRMDYASRYTLRKDGRWQGKWKDKDGKWHTTCDTDPVRLHKRIAALEAAGSPVVTLRDAAEAWEGRYRQTVTERTWQNLRPHYDDMVANWGKVPVAEITAADIIQDLERAKAQGYSRTVVNERKVIITGILNQALADGNIRFNPALSVRLPKGLKAGRRHYPGDPVIRAIFSHKDDDFGFFPFLLLCTGMRKSEALALHKGDIDLDKLEISVEKSLTYHTHRPIEKSTKNGKSRIVPIIETLEEPLRAYLASSGDILFPQPKTYKTGEGGGYMTEAAYRTLWGRWCRCAGLLDEKGNPTLTAHSLRHATATLLFDAGVDVYTAQKILGHSQVSTTMEIYTDLRDQKARASVSQFSEHIKRVAFGK